MKQNKNFIKPFNSNYLAVSLLSLVIVFLLGSCCIYYPANETSKNCRCNQKGLASLKNNTGIVNEKTATNSQDKPESKTQTELTQAKKEIVVPGYNNEKELLSQQTFKSKKLPLGIKAINTHILAGPNISNASIKETGLSKKSGAGFQLGIGSNYIFSKNFSMNPNLIFRQKNFSTSSGEGEYQTKTKYSYNYLSAPILARFRASDKLHFSVGPEINYLLSATSNTSSPGYYGEPGQSEKTKITDKSVRLGLGVEANATYQISKRLGVQIMYNIGVTPINKEVNPTYPDYNEYSDKGGWQEATIRLLIHLCNDAQDKGLIRKRVNKGNPILVFK